MAITQIDTNPDAPTDAQKAAEAAALEQGEKIAAMQAEDKAKAMEDVSAQNEEASLIGGKFKSQDDLLKAYNELQSKLGKKDGEEEEVEESEEGEVLEEEKEGEVEEVSETVQIMQDLGAQFDKGEELSVEKMEALEKMDSKELISAYMKYNELAGAKAQEVQLQANEIAAIQQSVGGADAYNEMVQWAASNLDDQEISDFNTVTSGGNPVAIKFAVQALETKFKSKEGYEAPLVTGKGSKGNAKVYRSQAELARDIANPLYASDPAFRMDVEAKLSRSTNLL
mgnify:CR=1 FL=1|tara:strand:- start:14564 stop:15412 length:849 start_codon:yes stop_codon:yes gene_type:complete